MKQRGFEVVSYYMKKGIAAPRRNTRASAGYDLASAETIEIPPGQSALIPTGLKAYMLDDEYLALHIRSSLAVRRSLVLTNSVGIIDSDYYNNLDNEGHILISVSNIGTESAVINKYERIAQGIFQKFLLADDDVKEGTRRVGGFGSTGIV